MTRTLVAIAAIIVGVVVQLWLLNPALHWLWVAGFFPENHPNAMRNAGVCSLPCFLIFAAQAAILWFVAVRPGLEHRRRRIRGQCQRCGYDLTGNFSGRCPECGGAIGADAKASDTSADRNLGSLL